MSDKSITIRPAVPGDAASFLSIYAPYILNTAITYEYVVPTEEEFAGRIRHVLEKYPYLAAEVNGKVVGYAYASAYGVRAAYGWTVETSIYVDRNCKGMGIGNALYQTLEVCLTVQGVRTLVANIAWPEEGDPYLTRDSAAFHKRMGYERVGTLRNMGCKFGRWYHLAVMEKYLGPHGQDPAPILPFSSVRAEIFPGNQFEK
ncbi:MAG: GNAT family N-acetyltransferase [Bacillota bacterium]|nr:GNAT family N-acetyltransferase [Bacillota bacterium]